MIVCARASYGGVVNAEFPEASEESRDAGHEEVLMSGRTGSPFRKLFRLGHPRRGTDGAFGEKYQPDKKIII